MNSEEQTRFGLEKPTERDELSKSILGISLFALASFVVVKTFQYLFRAEELPEELPPIIIKSGSFAIETEEALTPASAGAPAYRKVGFKKIKGIKVTYYKEKKKNPSADDFFENGDWDSAKGVQVNIDLQFCEEENGDCQSWSTGSTPSRISVFNDNDDFVLTTPIKLSTSKIKYHPKRKAKREDEHNQIFRFGKVEIREKVGGKLIKQYLAEDSQEYIIAFYNEL
jgi:hypothetical protein